MSTTLTTFITLLLVLETTCSINWAAFRFDQSKRAQQVDRNNNELTTSIRKQLDAVFAETSPSDDFNVPQDKLKAIDNLFEVGDKNHDGLLSLEELKDLASKHHVLTEEELKELIEVADENHDGKLSAHELAKYMVKRGLVVQKADINFKRDYASVIDLDKDGEISMEEFERLYRFCNENFNRELIYRIIKAGDKNGNLQLDYTEMNELIDTKPNVMTGGNIEQPTTNVISRIKYCMASFIDKIKNGPDYRPLTTFKNGKVSLMAVIKMPFMSSMSSSKVFQTKA